jgi:hypothetical protein
MGLSPGELGKKEHASAGAGLPSAFSPRTCLRCHLPTLVADLTDAPAANGLKQASPATGDRLLIPVAYRPTVVAKRAVVAKYRAKSPRKHPTVLTHTASNRASRAAGE